MSEIHLHLLQESPRDADGVFVRAVDGTSYTYREFLAQLGTRLARFKLPKRIVVVPELARNTMGKVQKNILRDTYGALYVDHKSR